VLPVPLLRPEPRQQAWGGTRTRLETALLTGVTVQAQVQVQVQE